VEIILTGAVYQIQEYSQKGDSCFAVKFNFSIYFSAMITTVPMILVVFPVTTATVERRFMPQYKK